MSLKMYSKNVVVSYIKTLLVKVFNLKTFEVCDVVLFKANKQTMFVCKLGWCHAYYKECLLLL